MQRADQNHFLKHGTTIYGEWFLDGKRIPRKDAAAHTAPLPSGRVFLNSDLDSEDVWRLADQDGVLPPDFPGLDHDLAITDGCGYQV
jgi:hypothetical protein